MPAATSCASTATRPRTTWPPPSPRLSRALPLLRQAGYRRIVLAGQSRGGWQSMMAAAERPDLVHAVLAFAPAAHGEVAPPNNHGAALEDFRRLLAGLPDGRPAPGRGRLRPRPLRPRPGRARRHGGGGRARRAARRRWRCIPEPPLEGHGGGSDWRFTRGHAPCLLTLVTAPGGGRGAGPAPRALRRRLMRRRQREARPRADWLRSSRARARTRSSSSAPVAGATTASTQFCPWRICRKIETRTPSERSCRPIT